ncbi:MAG: DUF3576 domain-containing protein [Sphingomonadales bacterium]
MKHYRKSRIVFRLCVIGALAVTLAGCGIFGGDKDKGLPGQAIAGVPGGALRVNAFLWRASLDTLQFMPLASTDSAGGLIVTEWHAPPDLAKERMKVNVHIMDLRLRADALRVTVFRQVRGDDGQWRDSPVKAGTAQRLEDAILTRARQLRIQSLSEK